MQALCIAANSGKRLVVSWQTSSQMLVSHSSKTEFHTCSYRILCNFWLQRYYFFSRYANNFCDFNVFCAFLRKKQVTRRLTCLEFHLFRTKLHVSAHKTYPHPSYISPSHPHINFSLLTHLYISNLRIVNINRKIWI